MKRVIKFMESSWNSIAYLELRDFLAHFQYLFFSVCVENKDSWKKRLLLHLTDLIVEEGAPRFTLYHFL